MMFLDLTGELASHVAVALVQHRKHLARSGLLAPAGFDELKDLLLARASQGQRGTSLADLWEFSESRVVTPMVMTYADVAKALACSERQVKRLVAAGDLTAVLVGGATRIRVADLDAYVAGLPGKGAA